MERTVTGRHQRKKLTVASKNKTATIEEVIQEEGVQEVEVHSESD